MSTAVSPTRPRTPSRVRVRDRDRAPGAPPPPLPEPTPRTPGGRIRAVLAPPLAVYAVAAGLHLLLLALMDPGDGPGLHARLLSWDAGLYVEIARDGYPDSFTYTSEGELTGNNLAFFPAYPALVAALHTVTGLDHTTTAVLAAHLSLLAALTAVHRLLTRLYDRCTATVAAVLLACAQPMSLVFFMGYSESLFLAFAAATLLAAHRKAWLTSGVLAMLAGLTRPAAAAVAAALAVAVVLHAVRARRIGRRPLAALVLAASGTPAYLWWVGHRLGRPDAWSTVQEAGWGTHWDNGRSFVAFLRDTLHRSGDWVPVSTAVLLLLLLAATAAAWQRTTWPPLLVYGTGILVLTLGQSNYFHCKLRLVAPALLFLVPAARALARCRPRTTVLALVTAALFGCWYGAYMLTAWHYTI
ncbi:hypothetical protein [Streptomyces sp. NPDC093225]|uniref:hypothetical protein n=1 Tax=Streptomyces sp. NPDC093225 TaxID=3366034 RepID=UPI0037FB01B1